MRPIQWLFFWGLQCISLLAISSEPYYSTLIVDSNNNPLGSAVYICWNSYGFGKHYLTSAHMVEGRKNLKDSFNNPLDIVKINSEYDLALLVTKNSNSDFLRPCLSLPPLLSVEINAEKENPFKIQKKVDIWADFNSPQITLIIEGFDTRQGQIQSLQYQSSIVSLYTKGLPGRDLIPELWMIKAPLRPGYSGGVVQGFYDFDTNSFLTGDPELRSRSYRTFLLGMISYIHVASERVAFIPAPVLLQWLRKDLPQGSLIFSLPGATINQTQQVIHLRGDRLIESGTGRTTDGGTGRTSDGSTGRTTDGGNLFHSQKVLSPFLKHLPTDWNSGFMTFDEIKKTDYRRWLHLVNGWIEGNSLPQRPQKLVGIYQKSSGSFYQSFYLNQWPSLISKEDLLQIPGVKAKSSECISMPVVLHKPAMSPSVHEVSICEKREQRKYLLEIQPSLNSQSEFVNTNLSWQAECGPSEQDCILTFKGNYGDEDLFALSLTTYKSKSSEIHLDGLGGIELILNKNIRIIGPH